MWCEHCDSVTSPLKTTIRITKDGNEVVICWCSTCLKKTEIEYGQVAKIRFKVERKRK